METSPHSLEESTLTTRRKKAEIVSENDKVFVEGIPTKPSENDTEGISDLDVKDITHDTKSSDNLNAIVTFYSPVGELRNDPQKTDGGVCCTVVGACIVLLKRTV